MGGTGELSDGVTGLRESEDQKCRDAFLAFFVTLIGPPTLFAGGSLRDRAETRGAEAVLKSHREAFLVEMGRAGHSTALISALEKCSHTRMWQRFMWGYGEMLCGRGTSGDLAARTHMHPQQFYRGCLWGARTRITGILVVRPMESLDLGSQPFPPAANHTRPSRASPAVGKDSLQSLRAPL